MVLCLHHSLSSYISSLLLKWFNSSLIISYMYSQVCMCAHKHTHIYNLLSPFSVAHMYMCLGLTTEDWITYPWTSTLVPSLVPHVLCLRVWCLQPQHLTFWEETKHTSNSLYWLGVSWSEENKIMKLVGKRLELEDVILTKVIKKNKTMHVISCLQTLAPSP